jgi:hypothetical protein
MQLKTSRSVAPSTVMELGSPLKVCYSAYRKLDPLRNAASAIIGLDYLLCLMN